jgi:uncharacterized RDD family membrane protein YckC
VDGKTYRPARFEERLRADLLDIAIAAAVSGLLYPLFAWLIHRLRPGRPSLWIDGFLAGFMTGGFVLTYWVLGVRTGGTPGKRILGLRVVHERSGRPPGLASSALNVAAAAVAGPVDELVALNDPHARALSERLAGTIVVRV